MGVVLELKNITKEFPGVKALDNVSFKLLKGEVLSIAGENGAGKSTIMNIISGSLKPSSGKIFINSKETEIKDLSHSQSLGISIIHQELSIIPNMSVAENIYALHEPQKYGLVDDRKMIKNASDLLRKLKMDIDPTILCSQLPVSKQQMVEIAKALSFDPDIIIMDEPTSALSSDETLNLLRIIKDLKDNGKSIIYISHKLNELFEISDRIAVLRDGLLVDSKDAKEIDEDHLVSLMVGREMKNIYPVKDFLYVSEDNCIEVKNYTLDNKFYDINFTIKSGEVLGLYGLMGSGRTEIAQGIFGILKKQSGEILLDGKKIEINSPYDAIQNKIAFVTEDRKTEGLILNADIKENVVSNSIDKILNKFGLINNIKECEMATSYVEKLRIKTPSIDQLLCNLSGGNQQKVVLSKWFEIAPKVLILDEPTRGIDVGAKYEIYEFIVELARMGMSILLISSDLPEVLNMSDRLLVIRDNRIISEMDSKKVSQKDVMLAITKEGIC
ncbi:MAG: sugar ABC transporter ATP-binding protein [Anaerorhabdus sp.]